MYLRRNEAVEIYGIILLLMIFLAPISITVVSKIIIKSGAKYNPSKLKKDAKVIDVSRYKRYNKRREMEIVTRIKFDDGFVYDAECASTEDFRMYKIHTITRDIELMAIKRAKIAHDKILGLPTEELEYNTTTYKYKCGGCGKKGPYGDACPNCGSRLKIADN